ncbi:Hyccin [Halotydeus destructor]|nr:Hyccin [Halotydeus destructor]
MKEDVFSRWLADWKDKKSSDGLLDNSEIIRAVYCIIEETKYHEKYLSEVLDVLLEYYRSGDDTLQLFTLSAIPSLIGLHLNTASSRAFERQTVLSVDVLILAIYNLDVIGEDGNLSKRTFRFPTLSKPSVYHESSLAAFQQIAPTSALTENALQKLEAFDLSGNAVISAQSSSTDDQCQINASNRWTVLTGLLQIYNKYTSSVPNLSLHSVCRNCVRILDNGYQRGQRPASFSSNAKGSFKYADILTSRKSAGICVNPSSHFLVEMCSALYVCMFNGLSDEAMQALHKVNLYATRSLHADVLLMVNAIKNSTKLKREKEDDILTGLHSAFSPTSNASSSSLLSKPALTNASFKTRKLPIDIPIQAPEIVATNGDANSAVIIVKEDL